MCIIKHIYIQDHAAILEYFFYLITLKIARTVFQRPLWTEKFQKLLTWLYVSAAYITAFNASF